HSILPEAAPLDSLASVYRLKGELIMSKGKRLISLTIMIVALLVAVLTLVDWGQAQKEQTQEQAIVDQLNRDLANQSKAFDAEIIINAARMIGEGRRIFRHDTFGDEAFWGDTLRLHQAIEGEKFGGVGPGLSPRAALNAGLKVDVD